MAYGKGRRNFAGKNMHIEYHNVSPKKKKAADCIYLTESRECQCKDSQYYLSKCFVASYCPHRVKETDAKPKTSVVTATPGKRSRIKNIKCSLPLNCVMYSNAYGKGNYTAYDAEKMHIEVTFNGKARSFVYPDAIFKKYLILPAFAFDLVVEDYIKAERG